MTATKDRFWAKVLFKEFIRHYRKMTAEQKVADIDASMDALEDLDDSGESFGAKMVRWSMERADQYPMASENGKKGGRPRKQEITADGDTREDSHDEKSGTSANNSEARQSQRTGAPVRGATSSTAPVRSLRLPKWDEFVAFVDGEGLDYTDARQWWDMTILDRAGKDRYGNPITNWKAACKRFCKSKTERRSA